MMLPTEAGQTYIFTNYNRCINMKKIVFSLLMLVPFGLVSCFSGASESSTEEIET